MMLFGPLLTLVTSSYWAERAAPRQDSKYTPGPRCGPPLLFHTVARHVTKRLTVSAVTIFRIVAWVVMVASHVPYRLVGVARTILALWPTTPCDASTPKLHPQGLIAARILRCDTGHRSGCKSASFNRQLDTKPALKNKRV